MRAFCENLVQVIFADVTVLNGEITEEALNMVISKELAHDRLSTATVADNGILVKEMLSPEDDTEKVEPNGAYLYVEGDTWKFERCNTIAEAVRKAVGCINAKVLCNGKVIEYDAIDDTEAYYIDEKHKKLRVVKL